MLFRFQQSVLTHRCWRSFARALILFSNLITAACQTSPLSPYIANTSLHVETIQGTAFKHLLVHNQASHLIATKIYGHRGKQPLNVYIEGDGRPWSTRYSIAHDPTPKVARMLALMELDNSPAVYLGRPCYFSLSDAKCEPIWWTHRRYSEDIISSMNNALDQLARNHTKIRMIGHSGGGALAMLMASRRDDVEAIVTLAGNIDIVGWANLHNYSPLEGSLNPADVSLAKAIRQFHFVGSDDLNTPAHIIEAGLHNQSQKSVYQGEVQIIEGADHHCCWTQHWPRILTLIEEDLKNNSTGLQTQKSQESSPAQPYVK